MGGESKAERKEGNIVKRESVFVPYWSLESSSDFSKYGRVVYFGVAANTSGLDENDQGYLNLDTFLDAVPSEKEKYLTLRMVNADVNFEVLKNEESQGKIITETIQLAAQNGFQGIVLDLELFSLFDNDISSQINNFVERFYTASQNSDLQFATAIYGDVFYRKRPFDVQRISKNSNEIMVMAYDFHKSTGEPGPNFPLERGKKYGYDFETMVSDFMNVVPPEKLTIIFGMYGYEWEVDEQKRPYKAASSLTLNQIREKYLSSCTFKNCVVLKDKESAETEINYVATDGRLHVVWFENEESVKQKKEFLSNEGIESYSYWAYSYF